MANFMEDSFGATEPIRSTDINRILQLIKNGLLTVPSGTIAQLSGKIQFSNLSPELQSTLNSLLVMVNPVTNVFTGVLGQQTYTMSTIPITSSVEAYINGAAQIPSTAFSISGSDITFAQPIAALDKIMVKFNTENALSLSTFASFSLPDQYIRCMIASALDTFFAYGENKITGLGQVGKFRQIDSTLLASFDVGSGNPDHNIMVRVGGYLWAIGGTTGLGTNVVTRIDENTLTSTPIAVTTDTGVNISSLATDGTTYIYALMEGGTMITANSIAKLTVGGSAVGVIATGVATTGNTSFVLSSNGFLYVAFDDPTVSQVRKIDPVPINGIKKIFDFDDPPNQLLPIGTDIYVLSGTKLYKISAIHDTLTLLKDYAIFTPSQLVFDGVNLWIAYNDTLLRCDLSGNIIDTVVPQSGTNILSLMSALGFIWTGY